MLKGGINFRSAFSALTVPPYISTSDVPLLERQLQRTYFYLNGVSEGHFPEQEVIRLDKAGYTVALNRVAVENAPPYLAAQNRSVLSSLIRRLSRGDLLVVLELSSLGGSPSDVLLTLMKCRKQGICVRCVEFGNVDLASSPEPQAVKMLRAIVRMDTMTRSERSSRGLKRAQLSGRPTGRPVSLSLKDRERVIDLLDQGLTVSEIARRLETSRQTIMRIRASSSAIVAAG